MTTEKLYAMAQVGLPDNPTTKDIFETVGKLQRAFLVSDDDARLVIKRIMHARFDTAQIINELLVLLEGESGTGSTYWQDNPAYQNAVTLWERLTGRSRGVEP